MSLYRSGLLSLFLLILIGPSFATGTIVSNLSAFNIAVAAANPGDTIILSNQNWSNTIFNFQGRNGTAALPIVLKAQTLGSVVISGYSRLFIGGNYLKVEGLVFRNAISPSGNLVEFKKTSGTYSTNSRLTKCVFINCNPSTQTDTSYRWVAIYGTFNRVDHCFFKGKSHLGPTLSVIRSEPNANYAQIDSSYFAYRPLLPINGGETVQIGTSTYSLSNSSSVVEYNYFEQCNGDIEIISNKSCDNSYLSNTFVSCAATVTMRHGNRCTIAGNFIFGNRVSGAGGIRLIGMDHKVYNNYIQGTTGNGFRSAIALAEAYTITDTTAANQLNTYFQVKRATVAFNTLVDNKYNITIGAGAGSDTLAVVAPDSITIANNVMLSLSGNIGSASITQSDTATHLTWQKNFAYGASLGISPVPSGITTSSDPLLTKAADGLYRPAANSPLIGTAQGTYSFVTADMDGQIRPAVKDVGADQYFNAAVLNKPMTPDDVGPGNISIGSGNWSDTTIWLYNTIPTAGNSAIISQGTTVTIDAVNAQCADLTIDGTVNYSGTSTGRAITVSGDLTINSTGVLSAVPRSSSGTELSDTLTLRGNLTNNGTLILRAGSGTTSGSNTVCAVNTIFAGTANSTVTVGAGSAASTVFNGLVFNKTGGAKTVLTDSVITNSAAAVLLPNISFTAGIVETGDNALISLSPNAIITGGSVSCYVNGKLGIAFPSSAVAKTFAIGDSVAYRPVILHSPTSGIGNGQYVMARISHSPAGNGSSTYAGGIDRVSDVRYYTISYFQGSSATSSVAFDYFTPSYSSDDGVTAGSTNLRVAYSSNNRAIWNGIGPSNHTAVITSNPTPIQSNTITPDIPALNNAQSLYVALGRNAGTTDIALPVMLTSFTGEVHGRAIVLQWKTATEINNAGFEVQRMKKFDQGISEWRSVGYVRGGGSSSVTRNYSLVDTIPDGPGTYAFRLKQVDFEGAATYSTQILIAFTPVPEFRLNHNYPNPFNPSTTIEFEIPVKQSVTLRVINLLGQNLATLLTGVQEAGFFKISFNPGEYGLSSGVYLYQLRAGNKVLTNKMVYIR